MVTGVAGPVLVMVGAAQRCSSVMEAGRARGPGLAQEVVLPIGGTGCGQGADRVQCASDFGPLKRGGRV